MSKHHDEPLIELNGLFKTYDGAGFGAAKKKVHAVHDVSLTIMPGETLGLVGESGCGKSTTGRMAARLLQPSAGNITYRGRDLSLLRGRESKTMRKAIQYVFQDPYASLNPKFTIADLLEEPLRIHKLGDKAERRRQVDAMLETIGLNSSYARRYVHELSGGQRQRIGIARALMLKPEFLILDEPVSALDVSVQSQILNLLKDLQKQYGLTYLFISHDLNVVHYMSDRVAVMYMGKLVEIADVEGLYHAPFHPYTQALISAIPSEQRGKRSERRLLTGEIPDALSIPEGCSFHTRCPYVRDSCRRETPPIIGMGESRTVRCHLYPVDEGLDYGETKVALG
ncbi:ABC transporter ATP-binding protein [Paenibacillus paeoniae]|uniref:ATP-binding cassette domain-containing protein n=1 Tax=Paenibacillus paeoniae TaxID=2292705 RepID=A0A371PIL2_9BACL|nr:oligopeptide/dipeptide ABC transporter ATP-binding protein [Paenibacillus paeoniae]REK76048.1 ATP-binding cassette domain-containing protein [Paenibacillus paeoniae]